MEFKFIFIPLPLFLLQFFFEFLAMPPGAPTPQTDRHPERSTEENDQIIRLRRRRGVPRMQDSDVNAGRRLTPQAVAVGSIDFERITSGTKAQVRSRGCPAVSKMPVIIQSHQHITVPVAFRIHIMHGRKTEYKIILRAAQLHLRTSAHRQTFLQIVRRPHSIDFQ